MLQWPVLEMTMMLNLIHSRTKGLEYPTHEEYSHGATLCIPWIPKSPNSRCLCSGIVTSHNLYVTLLTNLGQCRTPSHLSHPHHTQVPNNTRLFQSQSVLLFYIYVLVQLCSVIVSCLRLLSYQFIQEYSSHLLLCLIVFSFLLNLDSQ